MRVLWDAWVMPQQFAVCKHPSHTFLPCCTPLPPPYSQTLTLDNPNKFPVEYSILSSSPTFSVSPAGGIVKPSSSAEAIVRWAPPLDGSASGGTQKGSLVLTLVGGEQEPGEGGADNIPAAAHSLFPFHESDADWHGSICPAHLDDPARTRQPHLFRFRSSLWPLSKAHPQPHPTSSPRWSTCREYSPFQSPLDPFDPLPLPSPTPLLHPPPLPPPPGRSTCSA